MASRYKIDKSDLRRAALALQLGQGIADRFNNTETDAFITRAEDWADGQIDETLGVPLKPTPAPGQTTGFDPSNPAQRNYPVEFVQAIIYHATGLLLQSEYFENAPNASESGKWALQKADEFMLDFKDRRPLRVGAGRVRNTNPHMPPQIAPRFQMRQPPT